MAGKSIGDTPPSYPGSVRAWVFVAVLFIASIASVIDRAILNIVVDPLKADIGLSDVQIALLQGLAFGLFYAVVGLALGLTADRHSRRRLILFGMLLWSCATMGVGFAHSFASLFALRILVGLGEAALGPASISLIGDLFPPEKRGRPIGVFLMGQAIAIGVSIAVAGSVLQAARTGVFHSIAIIGALAPWRVLFVCCGAAAAPLLLLVIFMREPTRRSAPHLDNFKSQAAQCAAYFLENRAIFVPFYLGFSCVFAAAYGAGAWTPSMLTRQFGATSAQFAGALGPLSLMFGVLGPLLAGWLADHHALAASHAARLKTLSWVPLCALPAAFAVFAPGVNLAIVLVASMGAVTVMIGTLTFAALQAMVPGHMRGTAIALTGLVNTLIGATLGPLLIAEFTQHLYRDPRLVGYSIATLTVPALGLGVLCFARACKALRKMQHGVGGMALTETG